MSYLKYVVVLAVIYFATWTTSYLIVFVSRDGGLDFSHYVEYLVLAWTFRGGELPTFIWLFSIIAFLPLAVLAIRILRKYKDQVKDAD